MPSGQGSASDIGREFNTSAASGSYSPGGGSGGSSGGGVPWKPISDALGFLMALFGGRGGGSGMPDLMTPEMRDILKMQTARMRAQEPLYGDVMAMARGLLPTRYRVGGAMTTPGVAQPTTGVQPGKRQNPKPGDYPGPEPKPGTPGDEYTGWRAPRY